MTDLHSPAPIPTRAHRPPPSPSASFPPLDYPRAIPGPLSSLLIQPRNTLNTIARVPTRQSRHRGADVAGMTVWPTVSIDRADMRQIERSPGTPVATGLAVPKMSQFFSTVSSRFRLGRRLRRRLGGRSGLSAPLPHGPCGPAWPLIHAFHRLAAGLVDRQGRPFSIFTDGMAGLGQTLSPSLLK